MTVPSHSGEAHIACTFTGGERENETTLFENRPNTSALDHINDNDDHGPLGIRVPVHPLIFFLEKTSTVYLENSNPIVF
jgi:hypothetical protein